MDTSKHPQQGVQNEKSTVMGLGLMVYGLRIRVRVKVKVRIRVKD